MSTKQKFKTGDKVICVNNDSASALNIGQVYTVKKSGVGHVGDMLILNEFSKRLYCYRFVLAQQPTNRIVITQRADDWHVCFENNPNKWECAKTYTEALGKLMISHCKEFNISEIVIEKKVVELIARS